MGWGGASVAPAVVEDIAERARADEELEEWLIVLQNYSSADLKTPVAKSSYGPVTAVGSLAPPRLILSPEEVF